MYRWWLWLLLLAPAAAPAVPRVVVDVQPVHSLVAGVMAGVGEPVLLIRGGRSPHDYTLRPSDARALAEADLIVWVGDSLEAMLARPIASLASSAQVLELQKVPGMALLPVRHGGVWAEEEHEAGHGHGSIDPHLWLAPDNARRIVAAVAAKLSQIDPNHAARYEANATALTARIEQLQRELTTRLAPVRTTPFLVFHDAYQYFEHAFSLRAAGSVSVNPEQPIGARRMVQLRALVKARGAVCVFSEPQFPSPLVEALREGTAARSGVLDPVGADLAPGPQLWFELMRNLAANLATCLSAPQ